MATRVYHASDNSGGDTTTQSATVQTDHRTLTFTPDASSTYLILGYCETQVDNNSARDSQVRLYDDTAAAELELANIEMAATGGTEWYPVTFAYLATFGGSPSSQTYKLQHKLESTNTNTDSVCRNGSLVAVKLAAADAFMSNDGAGTSTANPGAWTDYNAAAGDDALIFTPGSTGDYLILAFARLGYSATTNGAQLRLLCEDGSTAVATTRWVPTDSTTRHTFACAVKRASLAASEHTFKLQHARNASGSGTSTLEYVRMVALRLDGFDANTATEDTGADTTTSASYVDLGDTRTDTLTTDIDYLLLATADVETNTLGVDTSVKLTDGTNTYAEPVIRTGVADRGLSFLVPRVVTGSGASVTHKFQGASNGTATLSLDEHRLYVLQLEASGGGGDATASPATVALTMAQPAAAAQAGATVSPATAALTLAQPAVAAAAHATPAPATAALVLAQPAVEPSAGATASPAATALVIAQPPVTATGSGSATPSPATVTLVLAQPAASASAGSTPSPATTALTLTQPAATAHAGSSTAPATVALTIAQPAVAATAGSTPSPATVALVLAQPAVTATGGGSGTGTPATVALVLTQPLVAASAGATVAPGTVALVLAQPAASAHAGGSASPAVVGLVLAQPPASATASSTATPAAVALLVTVPAASASAATAASPATVVLVLAIPAVTPTGDLILVVRGARLVGTRARTPTTAARSPLGGAVARRATVEPSRRRPPERP